MSRPLPPRGAIRPDRRSFQLVQNTCSVNTVDGFQAALSNRCPTIDLQPGVYHRPWPIVVDYPVRIIGDVHTTELQVGLAVRASGVAIHGIHFRPNRESAAKFNVGTGGTQGTGAIVVNRFDGDDRISGLTVTDVIIDGDGQLEQGINVGSAVSARLERIEVFDVLRYGINLAGSESPRVRGADIRDLRVAGVGDPVCQERSICAEVTDGRHIQEVCENQYGTECQTFGAAEHGLFVASSHTHVERAHIRDASWTGIGVAGRVSDDGVVLEPALNVTLEDIDIDGIGETLRPEAPGRGAGVGVYIERGVDGVLLRHACIGSETERGANVEWDHHQVGSAARNFAIEASEIRSQFVGIYYDSGVSDSLSVADTRFENNASTAIGVHPANPLTGFSFSGSQLSLPATACELAHVPYGALEASPPCSGL